LQRAGRSSVSPRFNRLSPGLVDLVTDKSVRAPGGVMIPSR
jgi:hypothetical protein